MVLADHGRHRWRAYMSSSSTRPFGCADGGHLRAGEEDDNMHALGKKTMDGMMAVTIVA